MRPNGTASALDPAWLDPAWDMVAPLDVRSANEFRQTQASISGRIKEQLHLGLPARPASARPARRSQSPIEWNVANKLRLSSRPLMEVLELPEAVGKGYFIEVHKTHELDSRVVAKLPSYARLRALTHRKLKDGTTRALIVLDGKGERPLGWLTARRADGTAMIYEYVRPLYEIVKPPEWSPRRTTFSIEVHRQFSEGSTCTCELAAGTKLHVQDSRRNHLMEPNVEPDEHALAVNDP